MDKDLWVIKDIEKLLIYEKDGSYTINVKGGNLTMNATELANFLETDCWYKLITRKDIATMLRQQQAEIESLKKEAALQRLSDFTQDAESFDRTASHMAGQYVSYLKLTNEEISDIRDEFLSPSGCNIYTFARAILRKAQE